MKHSIRSKKFISMILCFVLTFSFCLIQGFDFNAKAVVAGGVETGKIYNLKNFGSGKYLNVYGGYDANGQNVVQWSKDGSVEQNFKIVYDQSYGHYKLYAMCSSSGNNRVVDVARNNGSLVPGCNVDIWTPNDNDAQFWWLVYVGNGKYRIVLNYNTVCALTAVDDSNGTSSGKSSTSPGNVYVSSYNATDYQHWILEEVNPQRTIADGVYYLKNYKSNLYADVAASGGAGSNVSQWSFHGGKNQQWKVTYLNNGYYIIRPVHNNSLALSVNNNYDSNGSNINVSAAPPNNDPLQIPYYEQWKIILNYNGTYRIASRCSFNDKVLTVEDASTSSGANIIQYKYNATQNDEWIFLRNKTETNPNVNANSNYDRAAAAGYAVQYGENPNPDYRIPGYDCTSFVSQALYAGGMSELGKPLLPSQSDQENVNNWFYHYLGISYTWSITDNFAWHWGQFGGTGNLRAFRTIQYNSAASALDEWSNVYANLYEGDVIQIYNNSNNKIIHSVVVTHASANGGTDILYAQHDSEPNVNVSLKSKLYELETTSYGILIHRIKA